MKHCLTGLVVVASVALLTLLFSEIKSLMHIWTRWDSGNVTIRKNKSDHIKRITPSVAKGAYDKKDVLFVDARSGSEYEVEHIPGSISLPAESSNARILRQLGSTVLETHIIAYCGGTDCQSSLALAKQLVRQLGFERVEVLLGGFPAWKKAGFPISNDEVAGP